MPNYRLVDGYSSIIETFQAVEDGEAERQARARARREPAPSPATLGDRTDFCLERESDGGWQKVTAWVPHPLAPTPPTVTWT
jgi:hypothetical protein